MPAKIELLESLLREVSNDVYELYVEFNDSTPPALYGTLLGIHTKIDMGLNGEYIPEELRVQEMPDGKEN